MSDSSDSSDSGWNGNAFKQLLWRQSYDEIVKQQQEAAEYQQHQEQQPADHQEHQGEVSHDDKAEKSLRQGQQEMVAANIPEVNESSVQERWTTFEEEKLATEQMLSRCGAQAVLDKLGGEVSARTKLLEKLALSEREVKLQQQIIKQKQQLVRSKQALDLMFKKVKYNICHRLKKGGVVTAFKSTVDKEVSAAKQRLGLRCNYKQFNMEDMLATISRLAPGGKYLSTNPAPAPPRTPRLSAGLQRSLAKDARFSAVFPVPMRSSSFGKAVRQPAQCQEVAQLNGRGDYGIVSYGDHLYQEPSYDHLTQLYEEDFCLQSSEEPIDQGYYDDITEQQEYIDTDVSGEEELIIDVSVEASLCWDSDGNIYY